MVDRVDIVQDLELPWADAQGSSGGDGLALASAVGGAAGALAFAAGLFWWLGGFSAARKALCGAARYAPVHLERGGGAAAEKRGGGGTTYGAAFAPSEQELSQPLRAGGV